MVSHDDLIDVWGVENVVRFKWDDVVQLPLPQSAMKTLVEVGLPRRVNHLFESRPLTVMASPTNSEATCRFGSDLETELCVSSRSGEIVSLSLTREYPDRWVNGELAFFVEFLVLVARERARFPDLGDDEIDELIGVLEGRLRKLDDLALAHPENWWSVILEQMKDGLL
jgi:hypothetical protein